MLFWPRCLAFPQDRSTAVVRLPGITLPISFLELAYARRTVNVFSSLYPTG